MLMVLVGACDAGGSRGPGGADGAGSTGGTGGAGCAVECCVGAAGGCSSYTG